MLIIGPKLFFHMYGPAAQTSPELIFHIIKCREQKSVLLSVLSSHDFYSDDFVLRFCNLSDFVKLASMTANESFCFYFKQLKGLKTDLVEEESSH